jgi:hypothetical protein
MTVGVGCKKAASGSMPPSETRQRIGVILPQHRMWLWHQKAILALRRVFDVDIFTTTSASQYPLYFRLWVRLETKLFGQPELVKLTSMQTTPWANVAETDYAFLLNLSEAPIACDRKGSVIDVMYNGSRDSSALFTTLTAHKNPYLSFCLEGQEEPIVASYLSVQDWTVLVRGLQISFTRLVVLAERAAHHLIAGSRPPIPPQDSTASHTFSAGYFLFFVIRFLLGKSFGLLIRRFQLREHWSVALMWADNFPCAFPFRDFVALPDDRQRMFADPFLITADGKTWLFVEELDYTAGKGIISCTEVVKGRLPESPRSVLERPYHLSYPFVFRHGNELFMIPETGANNTVELYRARTFPYDWVLCQVLLDNIELYDATMLQYKNKWWLFGAVAQHGGSAQDELAIFYSESLAGPWQPHALNPVKSDCRSARPAGRLIVRDNRLLRPAQDCERGYGRGLVWLEVEELTTGAFKETEVARWPGSVARAEGLHTFNADQGVFAIDVRHVVWKPFFGKRSEW